MTQHTPGPWSVSARRGNPNEGCIGITADNVTDLATVWPWQEEIDEANARLIAAAPETLEAARAAEATLTLVLRTISAPPMTAELATQISEDIHALRAAIAKATGEA